jgi:hypothetical protein
LVDFKGVVVVFALHMSRIKLCASDPSYMNKNYSFTRIPIAAEEQEGRKAGRQEDRRTGQEDRKAGGQEDRTGGQEGRRAGGQKD